MSLSSPRASYHKKIKGVAPLIIYFVTSLIFRTETHFNFTENSPHATCHVGGTKLYFLTTLLFTTNKPANLLTVSVPFLALTSTV